LQCAYNAINGLPACLHGDIQNDLVRGQWGFDGLIVSDQDAIADVSRGHKYTDLVNGSALGIKAGCDQNDGNTYAENVGPAVQQGLVSEKDIDVALTRVLMQRFRVGSFAPAENNPYRRIPSSVLDSPAHRQLALEAAQQAIVVLENNRQTLPLLKSPALSVAVVGPMADNPTVMKGGKPDYTPSFITTILQGITAKAKAFGSSKVAYAAGSDISSPLAGGIKEASHIASVADITVICIGIDGGFRELVGG